MTPFEATLAIRMNPPGRRRYGIISDVHANLAALQAALAYLEQAGVDGILNLGDMVGYGSQPREVLELLMPRTDLISILGNHDRMLCGEDDPMMRDSARDILVKTTGTVTAAQLEFLRALPEQRQLADDGILLVHSSLTERDGYILSALDVKRNLERMRDCHAGFRLCLFGHTHIPMLIGSKSVHTDLKQTQTLPIDPDEIYLINPGSVGQPRDRSPRIAFGILDQGAQTMTFVRLDQPADREKIEN